LPSSIKWESYPSGAPFYVGVQKGIGHEREIDTVKMHIAGNIVKSSLVVQMVRIHTPTPFYEKRGLDIFKIVSDRLKFSNNQKESIQFGIENHMVGHKMGELKKSKLLNLRQNKNWDVLKNVIYGDEASRKHLFNPEEHEAKMQKAEELATQFGKKDEFEKKISALVNGRMIMDILPKIKGSDIGKIKDQTRDWIVMNDFNVSSEQISQFIQKAGNELGY
jgi:hypothetical protein